MVFTSAILTGCMLGPNFHSPAPPNTNSYAEVPLPAKTVRIPGTGKAGKAQIYVQGQNIPGEWWHLFRWPALNDLIKRGLANSPNLAAAYAALRQAQENFNVQVGNSMLPAFDANLGAQRQLFSGTAFGGGLKSSIF